MSCAPHDHFASRTMSKSSAACRSACLSEEDEVPIYLIPAHTIPEELVTVCIHLTAKGVELHAEKKFKTYLTVVSHLYQLGRRPHKQLRAVCTMLTPLSKVGMGHVLSSLR
jgi:hypothetical protein